MILSNFFSNVFFLRQKIVVGDFSYGHKSIKIQSWGEDSRLIIGKYCSIAKGVTVFLGGNHNSSWVSTFPFGHTSLLTFGTAKFSGHPLTNGDVRIGNDVWIGSGSTIMSGVVIGDGAIVAANSHVVKSIPAYEIWGGNPACFIKQRFSEEIKSNLMELKWWDYPVSQIQNVTQILNAEISLKSLETLRSKLKK